MIADLVLLLSVVLIRLPSLFDRTGEPLAWLAALAPFWIVVGLAAAGWRRKGRQAAPAHFAWKHTWPVLAFLGLVLISFPRAWAAGTISLAESGGHLFLWGTALVTAASLTLDGAGRGETRGWTRRLPTALEIYVLLNVGLHIAGLNSPKVIYSNQFDNPATMLGLLGIEKQRALFPMAAGISAFGAIAGAACVTSVFKIFRSPASPGGRAWGLLAFAAGLYAVLATDTRSAVLYAGLTILTAALLVRASARTLSRLMSALPYFAPAFPVLLFALVWGLARFEPFAALQRSSVDLATLNARTVVWSTAVENLLQPKLTHLVGYGYGGQVTSGVSKEYAFRFIRYSDPETRGLHNAALQYVFDLGYLGLAVFLVSFSRLLTALSSRADLLRSSMPSFALAVYLLLTGTSERIPTAYSQELFLIFLLLLVPAALGGLNLGEAEGPRRPKDDEGAGPL